VLTPKPVVASEREVEANPRARSARMRVAERVEEESEGRRMKDEG
jgi:16S rRNA (cytosine1402-N4)-methyltransferase